MSLTDNGNVSATSTDGATITDTSTVLLSGSSGASSRGALAGGVSSDEGEDAVGNEAVVASTSSKRFLCQRACIAASAFFLAALLKPPGIFWSLAAWTFFRRRPMPTRSSADFSSEYAIYRLRRI